MVKIKGEGTSLDWQIINSIKDVSAENVEFKNIAFHVETITDSDGNVFVKKKERLWVPIFKDDPDSFPPVDEEGFSEYVLLSFENYTLPLIGTYRVDEKGGAFCDDIHMPLNRFGLIVNAWRPLPERFKGEE